MTEATPTIPEAIAALYDARLLDLHTWTVGVVRSFNTATQRADVQPIPKGAHRDESDERVVVELPTLRNVPIAYMQWGEGSVTFDLKRGDTVMIFFCEHSLDQWLGGATGVDEPLDPGDDRRHSLSDAVIWPGLSRMRLPSRPGALTINAADVRVGSPDADERVALHSELLELRDWVAAQFATASGAGHVHGVSGAATTTITLASTEPQPPATPEGSDTLRVDN